MSQEQNIFRVIEQSTGSGKTALPAATPYYDSGLSPSQMNLPHNDWREHQQESLDWVIGEDSPGSVVALCQTLFLQDDNYLGEYNFDVHKGRRHYKCVHPEANWDTMADECKHADDGMRFCKYYYDCPYVISKQIAAGSLKCSLNYAYWLASKWGERHPPKWLFLDEAHGLSEQVTSWSGCTITEKERKDWFPELDFPTIGKPQSGTGSLFGPRSPVISPTKEAISWLNDCNLALRPQYTKLRRRAQSGNTQARKLLAQCESIGRKVRNCYDALCVSTNAWYVRSGVDALQYGRTIRPGFMAKPLTAKYHFSSLFVGSYNTVAMSATIGDFDIFAEELGIDEFVSRVVPSRFPPERRPIHVLDCPKMGYSKKESDRERELKFDHQAQLIFDFVNQYPPDWPGLIHVTRKVEEKLLAQRLQRKGLERAWFIPGHDETYIPTSDQLLAWNNHKLRFPNAILVTCSFSEGYNGLDEKINISAKVPFPVWGKSGSYENKWAMYNRKRYNMTSARRLAQQQGRNRRGRECDYDSNGIPAGANAICDGSISRVIGMLPEAVRESLVMS